MDVVQMETDHSKQFDDSPLDRIPTSWEVTNLGNSFDELYRYPTYYGIEYVEIGIPEVRGELIKADGTIDGNAGNFRYISKETANRFQRVRLESGDFVMTVRGTMGKIAMVPERLRGAVITANLIRMKFTKSMVVPEWARHFLRSEFFQDALDLATSATTIKTIQVPELCAITFWRPPTKEQRRIAEILDTIDEAIQKTEALISKLKAMKQGLLHDLLTRGLDKNGKLRDPKAHLTPFSDVVQVNPTTELHGLNDKTDVSFIPMSDVSESGQWVIRQTRSLKDIRNGHTCFRENDVLFAKITPCMENGKGGHAIGLVNGIGFGTTEFHVLRASSEIEPRYIYHWTMTAELRRKAEAQMTGSAGQRRVPAEFFNSFKIPLYPRSEQRKIIDILDNNDARIRTEEQYRDKLKLQKKGLMHDLLTGKVRVRI